MIEHGTDKLQRLVEMRSRPRPHEGEGDCHMEGQEWSVWVQLAAL
jgi:hypothetical protein